MCSLVWRAPLRQDASEALSAGRASDKAVACARRRKPQRERLTPATPTVGGTAAMAAGSASGGAHADPPPTLIQFERPMQIDGPPAAVAESTGLPKRGGTAEAHVEEVINSVLPPR